MQEKKKKALFWFRRDLRISDNVGLYYALKDCDMVAPVFIFDKTILNVLPSEDRRVEFIWNCVKNLKTSLKELGSDIIVKYAYSEKEIPELAKKFKVDYVYANEDYEPNARKRDLSIHDELALSNIELRLYRDTVIFSKNDLLNNQGQVFTNFTNYKNAWKKKLSPEYYCAYPVHNYYTNLAKFNSNEFPLLEKLGFEKTNLAEMKLEAGSLGAEILFERFKNKFIYFYKTLKNIPYSGGVSYLSVHNRYGTISIRRLLTETLNIRKIVDEKRKENCDAWIDELIWREFYMQLLFHYPHVAYEPFKKEYSDFPWENNFEWYSVWCEGKTGYPLIDAAMIQLNKTGYMHNSLRILVSSFLTKHLLIDYKLGEEYFANKLLDFDLSANNAGWQWAASTGCDAQPYFKIFNPVKQSEVFDSDAKFIKKYFPIFNNVPSKFLHEPWKYEKELEQFDIILGKDYPKPIVNYQERRKIVLSIFQKHLNLLK
jgi:deoxyribodipyrimidine photo-lyase